MTTRIQPWTEPELMDREAVFENLVEKALNRTMRALASEGVEDVLTAAATLPVDPTTEGAYSALQGTVMAEWTAQVSSTLYPFLTDTFSESAGRVVDGVQAASGIVVDQLTGTYADEVLQYAYNRMVGIGESLWLNIRDQLVEGYNAGESIPQIAERLTQVAGLTTPRALTVARTEIISAANNGSYLQMLDAGFDEAVTKVWLATEDTRTRLSHRHADNQGVDLTGEFNVDIYSGDVKTGTEPMEFPGDPSATPGNIINCRCSLAFDFEEDAEEVLVSAAAFIEKDHPRDKDGKFKKKGSADKYVKIPDTAPANTAPSAEKAAFILGKKWGNLTGGKKMAFLNAMVKDPDTWSKLSPELKSKIEDVPGHFLNPDNKKAAVKLIEKLLPAGEPDDDADTDVPAGRPVGGVDTKTGKALVPGKPVKLRVQLLYNTTFEDGAIMAVHKGSGERIVWNEGTKKIQRQKLSAAGKYETTEALSRGAAYAAWKDEDGWTVPDASDFATPKATTSAPQTPSVAVGKPVKIKVQLIYQTPFDDGDIVAVNPTTGETIHWDAKKKRMVVTSELGTTEYTRGALYKQFKDEDGWHLPADKKAAIPAPVPAKKAVPPAKSAKPAVKKAVPTPVPVATLEPVSTYEASDDANAIYQAWDTGMPGEIWNNGPFSVGLAKNGNLLFLDATPNGGVGIVKSADVNSENIDKALEAVMAGKTWTVDDAIPEVDPDEIVAPGGSDGVSAGQDTSPVSFGDAEVDDMKAEFDNPLIGDIVLENADIEVVKVSHSYVKVTHKASGESQNYEVTDLTAEHLNDFAELHATSAAPVVSVIAPVTNAVSADKAATLKDWAKQGDIPDGEELHNGADFKIYKVSPGSIVVYAKDANGDIIPTSGQVLFGDEITSQGIQNTLSQMGISGGPSTPLVPSPGPVSTAVDTTPVGSLPNPSSLKATGQTVGTHGGQIYKDANGDNWLFKPTSTSQKHLALAEVAAGKLHELAGLTTPAMGETTVDGKYGMIQKIIPNVTSPYAGSFNAKTVTQAQALQLQKEHVFDWLVSNHDSNGSNILKDADGNLIGIDKGQAYKFFGADTLDPTFNPNGHAVPITNQLFQQYIKSPLSVDINNKNQLNSFIKKIQAIPDDEFKAILRPYAEAAAKNGTLAKGGPSYLGLTTVPFPANDVEAFLNAAVDRKNSLDHTFTEFYKKLDDAADGQSVDWKISPAPIAPSPINPPTVATPTIKQKPIKLSQNILAGKPSQSYFDGQVIAEHPSSLERLVWNAKSKKYDIQLQTSSGKWETAYSYNKSAAVANLKDDAGWMTPSTPQVANSGTSAGDPTLAPNIAGAPQVHTLAPKTESVTPPKAIVAPKPKISVADLKAQADLSTVILPNAVKSSIWSNFRTKGLGGSSTVTLSSEPKDIFEGLLIAQAKHNTDNPSAPLSLLQVLRLVDVVGTEKSMSSVNQNLYEKKIIDWLRTPTGLQAAQKISDNFTVPDAGGSGGLSKIAVYNKVLEKFKEHHAKSLSPTAGWKAAMAALPPFQIKAHTPGQSYPEVTSASQGNQFGKDMIAKYGAIPAVSKSALKDYTGNDYGAMNDYMRTFGKSSSYMAEKAKLANAGLRPSPRALTVHRNSSTVFDDNWQPTLAQLQDFKGVVFTEDAFASTSHDGHTFNGKKYRFIIEVPEGTPIAWVDEFSKNSGETEFLLGAGLKYEILEITGPGTGTGASTAHKTAVIRMRVVP